MGTGNVQSERIDPRVETVLRRGSLAVYTFVALAALTMLAWWVAGDLLPGLGLREPPAVPNSPLCIALVAAAGVLFLIGRRRAGVALAALAFALAAVTLAEHLLGVDLGVDLSLMGSSGRLYPTTAVAVLLAAPAAATIGGGRPGLGQGLAFAGGAIAMLTLAGHASGVPELAGDSGAVLRMASPTATGLLLLAIARLIAEPDRAWMGTLASPGPGGQLVRKLVPLLVPLPVVAAYLVSEGSASGLWDRATAELILLMALMLALIVALIAQARTLDRLEWERLAAKERTASFFELSHDMLCTIGSDHRFAELNASWSRVLGFTEEELRSRPAIEFVHPDDRERTMAIAARAAAATDGDRPVTLENRYLVKGGGWRWLGWSYRLGHDGDYLYGRATDITERKRSEGQLAFLARFDQLTGLANRHNFQGRLGDHLAHASRYGWRGALLAIDLDGLKAVNDHGGHAAGDELLRLAARRMREGLRRSDVVARLGGDEFAVLLPEATGPEARVVAAKLVRGFAASDPDGPAPTASIGVVSISGPARAEELMAAADRALYEAKRAGGATFRVAESPRPPQPHLGEVTRA